LKRSRLAWLSALCLCALALDAGGDERPAQAEVVVLLHGLARSDRSMQPLAERLTAAGFRTFNVRYASRDHGPEVLVDQLDEALRACCREFERLHFVTHSLGGILVRAYAAERAPSNLGRVVMLAPPNHGSEYVDAFTDWPLFRVAAGPTGVQLGTSPDSLPNRLPPPRFEFGVIAGARSLNPLSSGVIPGESDGTVSIDSTKLEGMRDFITVDEAHGLIMRSPHVADQTIAFLRRGRFDAEPADAD